ncbi:NAD(P)-binding protein [Cryphonectria parasitica EP155]|uniref:NAD(P)-binding protein n=1 Tax=Cryphonectria parasitica (strain ATCC 38755 / EP155) TaxID=660469 RepID=A0A9P4XWQ7_CRYP1|nr:NAD(P)-binding protein [Cryphonectria parasitica EP155]KAF3762251.1 NAD(P)-binding protein [Cryphonectria parasitica EP155]
MASSKQSTIIVTGGTGKTGSCVTDLLVASGVPHIVATRSSGSADQLNSAEFDWMDETTWDNPFAAAAAAAGTDTSSPPPATTVFLVAPPVFHSSLIMNAFIDRVRSRHGVKRFVLLASTAVEAGGPAFGGTMARLAELGGKGEIEFAVLRPSWFQDNWSEQNNLRKPIKEEGKSYSATGDGKIPWVSKYDIAGCAFHALTDEKPVNGDVIILGPELLSYADVITVEMNVALLINSPDGQCANIIADVTGKKVVHVDLTGDELVARHVQNLGLPEEYARIMAGMDEAIKHGSEEKLNDVVQSMTGKKPRTFREFAEANKAVWL